MISLPLFWQHAILHLLFQFNTLNNNVGASESCHYNLFTTQSSCKITYALNILCLQYTFFESIDSARNGLLAWCTSLLLLPRAIIKIIRTIQIVKIINYVSIQLTYINFIRLNFTNFWNKNKTIHNLTHSVTISNAFLKSMKPWMSQFCCSKYFSTKQP